MCNSKLFRVITVLVATVLCGLFGNIAIAQSSGVLLADPEASSGPDAPNQLVLKKPIVKQWHYNFTSYVLGCANLECIFSINTYSNKYILISDFTCSVVALSGSHISYVYLRIIDKAGQTRWLFGNTLKTSGNGAQDFYSSTLNTNHLIRPGETANMIVNASGPNIDQFYCTVNGEAFKY